MARITKWTLFWRAFFVTLIFGHAANAASPQETRDWNRAKAANEASAYFRYLSLYPTGAFIQDAVEALSDIGAIQTRSASQLTGQDGDGRAEDNNGGRSGSGNSGGGQGGGGLY